MVGVNRDGVADRVILARLADLGVPSGFLGPIASGLAAANLVLFGFEDGTNDCIYKFYLEYWDRLVESVEKGDLTPAILHLGFKWGAATSARVAVTRYRCIPMLSWEHIFERVRSFHAGEGSQRSLEVVESILHAAKIRSANVVYLEGEGDDSPRRSYDVNIYAANLKVRDVEAELIAARDHFAIPKAPLERLMATIGGSALGHISGGRGRTGEEFLTFYYDVDA